jgi:ankyrin repeat protein
MKKLVLALLYSAFLTSNAMAMEDINLHHRLVTSVRANDIEQVRELINAGVDVNYYGHDEAFVLHDAAQAGSLELVEMLLQAGATVDDIDGDGDSPLHCAVQAGNLPVIELLIERGADVDSEGAEGTPIYIATRYGQTEALKVLIAQGATVTIAANYVARNGESQDHRIHSPLLYAIRNDDQEAAEILLEAGADSNLTLLDALTTNCWELIPNIIALGANTNHIDKAGHSIVQKFIFFYIKRKFSIIDSYISSMAWYAAFPHAYPDAFRDQRINDKLAELASLESVLQQTINLLLHEGMQIGKDDIQCARDNGFESTAQLLESRYNQRAATIALRITRDEDSCAITQSNLGEPGCLAEIVENIYRYL